MDVWAALNNERVKHGRRWNMVSAAIKHDGDSSDGAR